MKYVVAFALGLATTELAACNVSGLNAPFAPGAPSEASSRVVLDARPAVPGTTGALQRLYVALNENAPNRDYVDVYRLGGPTPTFENRIKVAGKTQFISLASTPDAVFVALLFSRGGIHAYRHGQARAAYTIDACYPSSLFTLGSKLYAVTSGVVKGHTCSGSSNDEVDIYDPGVHVPSKRIRVATDTELLSVDARGNIYTLQDGKRGQLVVEYNHFGSVVRLFNLDGLPGQGPRQQTATAICTSLCRRPPVAGSAPSPWSDTTWGVGRQRTFPLRETLQSQRGSLPTHWAHYTWTTFLRRGPKAPFMSTTHKAVSRLASSTAVSVSRLARRIFHFSHHWRSII